MTLQAKTGTLTNDERERLLLAPFAMRSCDSRGRRHAEAEHPYRGPFQRDRDRLLHCSAFRRLSGKMQVFTDERGDYHRTRLTHTHEVASIARTISRALRLNEDLVEALALFHDIGHPPFGHAGEDALDECLRDHGGFSHNQYGLTIAEELESRYHELPGLNLTFEVLDGQTVRANKQALGLEPLLEVQLVDAADSVTYDAHDVDDAVKLDLVTLDEFAETPLVRESLRQVRESGGSFSVDRLRKAVVYNLIDRQVTDVLEHSAMELSQRQFADAHEARESSFRISVSPALTEQKQELEAFLYERVYRHPELVRMRGEAQRRLSRLFAEFAERPDRLPDRYRQRAEEVGLHRSIGDYLAGMTDRYCDQLYMQLVTSP